MKQTPTKPATAETHRVFGDPDLQSTSTIGVELKRRYLLALTILALLSGAAYASLRSVILSHETSSAIINVSGRQRMLSQRIALFAYRHVEAREAEAPGFREKLREAASLMRVSHAGLTEGNEAMGLPAQMSEAVRAAYFGAPLELDRQVREYLAHIESLLAARGEALVAENADLQHILVAGPGRLLSSLDLMVSQYEHEAEARIAGLRRLESWVLFLTLTTLLLEGVFIFRPLVNKVEEDRLGLLEAQGQLRQVASHDPLTELPNRRLFRDRLEQALAQARRHGTKVGVLHLDLDHFKEINDTLGHAAGDNLLRNVAYRIKSTLREYDTVARLGGDEFGVILPDLFKHVDAAELTERISAVLSEPFSYEGQNIRSTTSIGTAMFPDDAKQAEQLLTNADIAMYFTKETNLGGHCSFLPAMKAEVERRSACEAALRAAVAREEFTVHYQPQVRLSDGRVTGLEALARWQHPRLGTIEMGEFLATAVASGLIVPIGELLLHQACEQMRRWLDHGVAPRRLSVNLVPAQLRQSGLPETIAGMLEDTGVDPKYLELEVTQGAMLSHEQDRVRGVLVRLHQLGVGLSLDRFGTGYASLKHLTQWPVSCLKIDPSFICNLENDTDDAAIVRHLIDLGRSMSLDVIATGVERRAQSDFLKHHGCDLAQGFFFARPLPGETVSQLLASGAA